MVEDAQIVPASPVAKVTFVADDRLFVRVHYRNGTSADASFGEPTVLDAGDVVFVDADANTIEPAPDGLWPDSLWIGVVRLVTYSVTVVTDHLGHLRRLTTRPNIDYEPGNTVECDDDGVVDVLSKDPIKLFDFGSEEVDLSQFKPSVEEGMTFEDFGGLEDVIDRARELIEVPLQHREDLAAIGARPIKGVLFTGPPGTGKTMLARIIAKEAGAAFYAISGPTIFSKWFGESENVLRRIFAEAADQDASIIFFDEIDSVAIKRDADAHEVSKRVVAQLLALMDGFAKTANVIVIAATNRKDAIDEALRRPGRFDWELEFRSPDLGDRRKILERSGKDIACDEALPYAFVAARTDGWSAADLAAIWSEAALLAVVDNNRRVIVAEDFLGGFERVAAGQQHRREDGMTIEATK